MEFLALLPGAALLCMFAFKAGQLTKEYPTEEEMIKRIVSARAERHVEKWTAAEVEREIEEAAQAKAHRS